MFGAILKATYSSVQKGMTLCCSIYVTKVMNLLAFIFEQPSYIRESQPIVIDRQNDYMYNTLLIINVVRAPIFSIDFIIQMERIFIVLFLPLAYDLKPFLSCQSLIND